ncbi:LOW QUALITY PROTEIN: wall-associated receptor kinase-like 14 [Cynara cardunculus var. scolymus]|uniref:LOW QUALITY PROTEIN: wall-associated receptor kinase-like 14 n=1 Tax=Cynara cardunculus var. scolymus TaxID=59895 RepID=UPI000D6259F5|nr:LOW QUALITY PROTEIN: wall-associated receptor kinase-like 14 [Cynara cardunculus var. scolymus]
MTYQSQRFSLSISVFSGEKFCHNSISNMIFHLLIFSVILIITSPPSSSAKANCTRVCIGGGRETLVQFPFGFNSDCEIGLHCSEDGKIQVGGYDVHNFTRDHILVNLPAKCDRGFEEIRFFSGLNYALTSRNGLLLENCRSTLNDCVVSPTRVENHFNLQQCNSSTNRSMNCYSEDNPDREEFLNLTRLETAGCKILFSSVTVDLNGTNPESSPVSLDFQSVQLGWWMQGDCGCHRNAACRNVSIDNTRIGYRCHCNEGYDGDGFRDGNGCHQVSNCDASRYMSGKCGGTTRVGVLVGGIVAGASLMSTVALVCYCLRRRATLKNQRNAKRQFSEATGSFSVPFYHYRAIERATNSFSEKQRLGVGAYGTVYAGKLGNNEWVAVKKIRHRDTDGGDQVLNEIKLISSVNHPNLVRLLGYCIEKGEQILVYEFMPNGTLSQHLQRERGKGLPWTVRLTIAAETAQAIAHLHTAMTPPIYHRDIKSSNILLDYNFTSKVADFGLSRLGMLDDSHISTAPQGTPGYVDPQYHQNFHLSDKSDVYSFGVVLIEMITALKVVDFSRHHTEINLAALAIDRIGKGCVDDIIDPFLDPNRDAWTLSTIHKVAELAFRCLAFHRDMRPSMTEVADELEQIRLGGWTTIDDNVTMASSSVASVSSSPFNGSEKSIGGTIVKKVAAISSRRLGVPNLRPDCLSKTEEEKDSSPVCVQDPWLSEQSSPSTNSLLGNVVR